MIEQMLELGDEAESWSPVVELSGGDEYWNGVID